MTDDFIHTGQTFTDRDAAYCPLERKRRGPAALVAALSVMFAGGGFLMFSALSIPQPAPEVRAEAPVLPAPAQYSQTEAGQIAADVIDTSDIGAADIDDALAQSRAARLQGRIASATVAAPQSGPKAGQDSVLTPRLKPQTGPTVASLRAATDNAPMPTLTDGATPSLKPEAQPAASGAASHQPMRLGGLVLASETDMPAPFFFASDINRRTTTRTAPAIALAADIARAPEDVRIRIAKGENFVDALKRAGVSASDANSAAYAFGEYQDLRRLLPGQELALTLGWPNETLFQHVSHKAAPGTKLMQLEFRADAENRIIVRADPAGAMTANKKTIPLTTRVMSIAGQINGSLYMSAKAVGAPDEVIANLADAFAYDVDFQREIFGGDEFEAIFEVRYDDLGKLVSAGDIMYARLKWRGRSREKGYYRFAEDGGRADFYDASGQSAKRLLMKTPIDGARLSSGFGTRKHPILGYRKAHKGIDFAARRGTPIKAAGDGTILRANRYGSFGNYVKIRHANGYETAYAHLNGFARGIRAGKRVRQGDIIAYVGTTGRSTGPHLHYEVHHRGAAVNPQRLKIATGKQLTGAELQRFHQQRDTINAMRMAPAERDALYARDNGGTQGAL